MGKRDGIKDEEKVSKPKQTKVQPQADPALPAHLFRVFEESHIVTRDQWGAHEPLKELEPMNVPVTNVLLTYTGTQPCDKTEDCTRMMRELQEEYQKNNIPDIAPNFVVGGDGVIYEGRGWKTKPMIHNDVPDLHGKSIEISHFGEKGDFPPEANIWIAFDLIQFGIQNKLIKKDPNFKACYFSKEVEEMLYKKY